MDLDQLLQQRSLAWESLKRSAVSLAAIDQAIENIKKAERKCLKSLEE